MADEKKVNDSFDVIPEKEAEAESISMDDVMKSAIEDAAAAAAAEEDRVDAGGESATTVLTADMIGQPEEMATTVLTTDMLTQQGVNAADEPATTILTTDMLTQQGGAAPQGPMNNMPQNTGFNSGPQGMQVPGSGMLQNSGPLPGSGPLMSGSGPLPQMKMPQPPETAKKSSPGAKAFGIVSLILAVLGLAAVIICYFLFAIPKDDYQKASTSKINAPTVTTATTEEPEATEAPEEAETPGEPETEEE